MPRGAQRPHGPRRSTSSTARCTPRRSSSAAAQSWPPRTTRCTRWTRAYRQLWRQHLGAPSPARERPCGNIDPLGITGTPIYEPATGLVFVAAEYGGPARHELVALDAATGTVRWRRSIDLPGVQTRGHAAARRARGRGRAGVGAVRRTGRRLRRVQGPASSACGWTAPAAPLAYTVPTAREGGIWAPPGPSVDASGHLYVAVGNGESGPGDPYDHSDSVLELDARARAARLVLADHLGQRQRRRPRPRLAGPGAGRARGCSSPASPAPPTCCAVTTSAASAARSARRRSAPSYGGTAVDGDVVYVPCDDGVRAVRIDARRARCISSGESRPTRVDRLADRRRRAGVGARSRRRRAARARPADRRDRAGRSTVGATSRFAHPRGHRRRRARPDPGRADACVRTG